VDTKAPSDSSELGKGGIRLVAKTSGGDGHKNLTEYELLNLVNRSALGPEVTSVTAD
jgi:hypothetical protein